MNAIKATVMQGRLEPKVPLDWPDGTEVLIEPTMAPLEKIGIDESEWRDDPESLADWEAWIKTIEPFELGVTTGLTSPSASVFCRRAVDLRAPCGISKRHSILR